MPDSSQLDEFIERIVREVIRRLRAEEARGVVAAMNQEPKVDKTHLLTERLITASLINALPAGTSEVTIEAKAILTPLAKDEARDRGVRIVRSTKGNTA
jgi:hypothetical protein